MSAIKKWLLGDENRIMINSSIWNLVYSIEYSLLSAILMLVVTRISGLYEAGIFMLAYTVTQMMATIGSYGMRSFQASDIKGQYSFSTYYSSRIVSVLAMVVICMGYSFFHGYSGQRIILVVILCAYRLVEDVEDVFHAEMQKNMRLDVASKIAAIRIAVATMCFLLVFLVSQNLIMASLALTVSATVVTLLLTVLVSKQFKNITLRTEWNEVANLLIDCLPICVGGFLYNYLVNAPKYAIDNNLSAETQTIFNILFMPIFVINMFSSFIFKPLIVHMGILWNEKKYRKLRILVLRQLLLILGFTIFTIVGGILIGLDALGWIYGVSLKEYRLFFVVLILFGGVAAIVSFLVVVLTVVRRQKVIIGAYVLAAIGVWVFADRLVKKLEIWGAGILYGMTMGIVMLILGFALVESLCKKEI